jgi:hypothetical protein
MDYLLNQDLIALRLLYQKELDFDLCNKRNAEHAFYKNYQFLLQLETKSEEYIKYYFTIYLVQLCIYKNLEN